MQLQNIIKVLNIVAKYVKPGDDYVGAMHDIVLLPLRTSDPITEEDIAELKSLGAHVSSEGSGDCWAFFT